MNSMNNKKDLIVEDVIYFIENEDGSIESNAKNCFFYVFLMEHSKSPVQGNKNKKAAEDFAAYQAIFAYLLGKGYLTDERYCIDFDPINGGACFSLNLGKLLTDVNLEDELTATLSGKITSDYIQTFCNPTDSLRCNYCGAVSYSRRITADTKNGNVPCCLACHPLKQSICDQIKTVFDNEGTLAAVEKRLALIEQYSVVQIPPGKSINILIDEFLCGHATDVEDIIVVEIRRILEDLGIDIFDVATTDDFDILLLNRSELADLNVFSECVATDFETGEILTFFNKEGVVMTDDNAVHFIAKLQKEMLNSN